VTNVTFSIEISRNTNPKKKIGRTWHIMSPLFKKMGGHVLRVSHQLAPMHGHNEGGPWAMVTISRFQFATNHFVNFAEMSFHGWVNMMTLSSKRKQSVWLPLRDEHGSGLDRSGSGLTPILAESGLDWTAIFLKIGVSWPDRTENIYVVLMRLLRTFPKF